MSDNISVRIDLGVAKLEFAGVAIEQPIGITLELPRERIAELILGGAAINPVVAKVEAAVVKATDPVDETPPSVVKTADRVDAPAPVAATASETRRSEVGKLTRLSYDDLRAKLSSMTATEAATDLGVSVSLIYEYRRRFGIVGWVKPRSTKKAATPKAASQSGKTEAWGSTGTGKLTRYGDAYLRDKLSSMSAADAMAEFGVSEAAIYQHRKRLGIGTRTPKAPKVDLPAIQSFTDDSDIELREMLAGRQWSSIAFDHGVSITAVIAEGKRLGVPQPVKAVEEVTHADTSFRVAAAEGTADVHA